MDLEKDLFRPSEVAALCGVSRNTVYRWIRRNLFDAVRIGGCTFVRGSELRAFLNGKLEIKTETELKPSSKDDRAREAERMLRSFRNGTRLRSTR